MCPTVCLYSVLFVIEDMSYDEAYKSIWVRERGEVAECHLFPRVFMDIELYHWNGVRLNVFEMNIGYWDTHHVHLSVNMNITYVCLKGAIEKCRNSDVGYYIVYIHTVCHRLVGMRRVYSEFSMTFNIRKQWVIYTPDKHDTRVKNFQSMRPRTAYMCGVDSNMWWLKWIYVNKCNCMYL